METFSRKDSRKESKIHKVKEGGREKGRFGSFVTP